MSQVGPAQPRFAPPRKVFSRGLGLAVKVALTAAVVSLCLEYGSEQPPVRLGFLLGCQFAAVALVLIEHVHRIIALRRRRLDVRPEAWGLGLIVAGALVILAVFEFARFPVLRAATISVVAVQGVLLLRVAVGVARFNLELSQSRLRPGRLMVLSFVGLILVGGGLLCLPKAMTPEHRHEEGPYEAKRVLNCFFTATSAVCVTGLVVYDTGSDFTPFGQTVILVLIQMGGLGIMIFGSLFGLLVGRQLSLRQSLVLQDALSHQTVGEIGRMIRFIVAITFAVEAIGAVLLYPMSDGWAGGTGGRVFYSVFHAVSAFCNSGFGLHADSLVPHSGAWQVYGVVMPAIVLGGLGFPVLHDLYRRAWSMLPRRPAGAEVVTRDPFDIRARRPRRHRFSLHSKLVLISTAVLIVGPALLLLLFESTREWRSRRQIETARLRADAEGQVATMPEQSLPAQAVAALFQSVTARTAGFNTVHMDVDSMSPASHFLLCLLMFIGGSPASTAGGAKTVGIAVLMLGVYATLRRRAQVECFGRTIPFVVVRRAAAVVMVMFCVVAVVTLALCYTESASLQRVSFEAVSACGTVGLTTGLTDELTVPGRVIIILAMFVGRLGPLTVLIALAGRDAPGRYEYPEEAPIIG